MCNQLPVQPEYTLDNSAIYSRHLPTIKQLQYFLVVCEEGNFRKAASKLWISQPPLSMQIKVLEEKLKPRYLYAIPVMCCLLHRAGNFEIRPEAGCKVYR